MIAGRSDKWPYPQFPSAALEVLEITPSTGVGDSVTIRYRLIDELTGYRNNWQRLPH